MPFVRLGCGKGMEGCLLRRRETENGNGTSLLSQVQYFTLKPSLVGLITLYFTKSVYIIRPSIELKWGIYMHLVPHVGHRQ